MINSVRDDVIELMIKDRSLELMDRYLQALEAAHFEKSQWPTLADKLMQLAPEKKIQQIVVLRLVLKIGLKEAKDLMDSAHERWLEGQGTTLAKQNRLKETKYDLEQAVLKVANVANQDLDDIENAIPTHKWKVLGDLRDALREWKMASQAFHDAVGGR